MSPKRTIVVFSDIEMGGGDHLDDFPHPHFLAELIDAYASPSYGDRGVVLVFNGDTFDFLKLAVAGGHPSHITSQTALTKLETVAAVHQPFFEALQRFLACGSAPREVYFVVGNHDPELLFPSVRKRIRVLCGDSDRVFFPGHELRLGSVHLEHGHQYDPLFFMDPQRPFISSDPEPLLNLSWAAIGLLQVVIPLHKDLAFYDRLVPREELMELVPELTELFNALAWRYWTKDFWQAFLLKKDPLMRFSWTMLKEVIRRFVLTNPDVEIDRAWLTNTLERKRARLFVTGHLHRLAHHWHQGKRVVQLGAMRDAYRILEGGTAFEPVLKTWLEIDLDGDVIDGLTTRERRGPPRPSEELPDTVFDLAPIVRAKLGALGDRAGEAAAQLAQERKEKR
ncbi:MAG: metallophosphoesterase [Myxococcota bacterium]